jgi:hypothetical protein
VQTDNSEKRKPAQPHTTSAVSSTIAIFLSPKLLNGLHDVHSLYLHLTSNIYSGQLSTDLDISTCCTTSLAPAPSLDLNTMAAMDKIKAKMQSLRDEADAAIAKNETLEAKLKEYDARHNAVSSLCRQTGIEMLICLSVKF